METNLDFITDEFFSSLTPKQINNGDCFNWAYAAYLLFRTKGICKLFTVKNHGGHAFIKIGTLFYDAEAPTGVEDWKNLPFFKNLVGGRYGVYDKDAERHGIKEFLEYWKTNGFNGNKLASFPAKVKNYKQSNAR